MCSMKEERHNPNPSGKAGKPITLPPMSFDDAVRKMLGTQLPIHEPKPKTTKKAAKSKRRD
jgi:hypothetical protein